MVIEKKSYTIKRPGVWNLEIWGVHLAPCSQPPQIKLWNENRRNRLCFVCAGLCQKLRHLWSFTWRLKKKNLWERLGTWQPPQSNFKMKICAIVCASLVQVCAVSFIVCAPLFWKIFTYLMGGAGDMVATRIEF